MFNAILKQVYYKEDLYNADMLRCQVALFMVKNPDVFHDYVLHHLLEDEESSESYCWNIFCGDSWGDHMCVVVISKMWNVAISIISPMYHKPLQLFHNKEKPPIVLIANAGDPTSQVPCIHFLASKSKSSYDVLPGSAMKFEDSVPKKLQCKEKGEKAAKKWCIKLATRTVATKYNELTTQVKYVKTKMMKVSVQYHQLEKIHVKLGE